MYTAGGFIYTFFVFTGCDNALPATNSTTTVPTTQPPSNEIALNWTMDAKVVDPDGQLISNSTVTINGTIVKNSETADNIQLEILFPLGFRYSVSPTGYQEYKDNGYGFFDSHYVCTASVYDRIGNAPAFLTFALDAEAECVIFLLPGEPEQYLVASTAAEVDPHEVMSHFQAFLNAHNANN